MRGCTSNPGFKKTPWHLLLRMFVQTPKHFPKGALLTAFCSPDMALHRKKNNKKTKHSTGDQTLREADMFTQAKKSWRFIHFSCRMQILFISKRMCLFIVSCGCATIPDMYGDPISEEDGRRRRLLYISTNKLFIKKKKKKKRKKNWELIRLEYTCTPIYIERTKDVVWSKSQNPQHSLLKSQTIQFQLIKLKIFGTTLSPYCLICFIL